MAVKAPLVAAEPIDLPGIDPRIRAFRSQGFVDAFVVLTERFTILVDTLVSPEAAEVMAAWHDDSSGRQLLVINTHDHWDHIWGNSLFDGSSARFPAPIIGSAATRRGHDPEKAKEFVRSMRKANPGLYDNVEIRLPTIEIGGESTIYGGDLTLRLFPTPGHRPDHLAVWIEELRLLIAGDAAELPMPFVDDPAGLPALRASLALMNKMAAGVVLYSHGGAFTDASLIGHNIWYFDEAERRLHAALIGNRTDAESAANTVLGEWPLEDALPSGVNVQELFSEEFYRSSHDRAVRGLAAWMSTSHQAGDGE